MTTVTPTSPASRVLQAGHNGSDFGRDHRPIGAGFLADKPGEMVRETGQRLGEALSKDCRSAGLLAAQSEPAALAAPMATAASSAPESGTRRKAIPVTGF